MKTDAVRAWIAACRPKTLSAASVPVLTGSACAHSDGGFAWGPALAALGGALCLQVGANLANDVFDHEKGADTAERVGPMRVVQAGLIDAAAVRRAMWLAFAIALGFGVYLTAVAGPVIILVGVLSITAALAYTGGPYPLGYHGLGDVMVFLFFGLIATTGSCFVQTKSLSPLAVAASIPIGTLSTAILVVNNLRDRHTDAAAGKRTLAVRWGRTGTVAEYAVLVMVALSVPALLVVSGWLGLFALLPLLSFPLSLRLVQQVRRYEGEQLNACLVSTAKLLALFGVLFSLGITLDATL